MAIVTDRLTGTHYLFKETAYINVKDYGAAGDGAKDDRGAIVAAIADATTKGLPVFFPAGTYIKSGASIPIPSGVTLFGVGKASLLKNSTGANSPLLINADTSTGNSGIVIADLAFDGNAATQTEQFSVLDFMRITSCEFRNLDVRGGYRKFSFPNGTHGEGLVLRNSDHNLISGGNYHDNVYDGIKLRSSNYNRIEGVTAENNGRSGIQISFQSNNTTPPYNDNENVYSAGSNFNTVVGNTIKHTTGTPSNVAPTTSGIYLHTAGNNTISGNTIYGLRQGIGIYGAAIDNAVTGNIIAFRYVDKAGLDIEGGTGGGNDRNIFTGNIVTALSGNNPLYARLNLTSSSQFNANRYSMQGATGTPTRQLSSSSSGCRITFEGADGTFTDAGTNNTVLGNFAGSPNVLYFGAAFDTLIHRPAANTLSLGADDVLKTGQASTASRPSASSVGKGAQFYDTTLNRPIWSDGTVWKDASGNTV